MGGSFHAFIVSDPDTKSVTEFAVLAIRSNRIRSLDANLRNMSKYPLTPGMKPGAGSGLAATSRLMLQSRPQPRRSSR